MRPSEHHAQFIALQETGVTENQLPSLSHRLRLRGWSLSAILARAFKGGGRGGLAILAREPLTTEVLHQAVSEEGQLLSVQVFGTKEPWVIHCGYRRPAMDDSELLLELSASVSITRHRPWVFACDWNDDPHDSSLQATLQDIDGRVIATSQHQRSTRPTDSVWTRSDMKAVSQSLPFISDHSGSLVELSEVQSLRSLPAWCLTPVRALLEDRPNDTQEQVTPLLGSGSMPRQSLALGCPGPGC